MTPLRRWDVFCRVIDNYGDIAVSWRLARMLAQAHGFSVRLWVDQPAPLARLVPAVDVSAPCQQVQGVEVRQWTAHSTFDDAAEVVIEAFGCGLPESYIRCMAAREPRPRWIVLEYLSAEPWVREHHGLPSPHPRVDVPRRFFFPGVTAGTGGLPCEPDLMAQRDAFDAEARRAWWRRLAWDEPPSGALVVSLFAYADAPYAALWDALQASTVPVVLAAPEGHAACAMRALAAREDGARTVQLRVLPFLPQDDYDRLLWACDVNFVRGEDSFARAQWAGLPFVWQIYAQAEAAHEVKLDAFLASYQAVCGAGAEDAMARMQALWRAWNRGQSATPLAGAWRDYAATLPAQLAAARRWRSHLSTLGGLTGHLVEFAKNML